MLFLETSIHAIFLATNINSKNKYNFFLGHPKHLFYAFTIWLFFKTDRECSLDFQRRIGYIFFQF